MAAFSPDEKELGWARRELEPYGVTLYTDYDKLLKHEGLEAVCIATVTTVHAEQTVKAMEADLHVLCEKPISTSVEIVSIAVLQYFVISIRLHRTYHWEQNTYPGAIRLKTAIN